jgi:hypothetical protein
MPITSHIQAESVKSKKLNHSALAALPERAKRRLAGEALVSTTTLARVAEGRGRISSEVRLVEAAVRLGMVEVLS